MNAYETITPTSGLAIGTPARTTRMVNLNEMETAMRTAHWDEKTIELCFRGDPVQRANVGKEHLVLKAGV